MKLSSVMSHLTILYWHRHFLTNSIFKFFKSYKNTSLHTNSKVSAGQIYSIFARSRFWSPMCAETDKRLYCLRKNFRSYIWRLRLRYNLLILAVDAEEVDELQDGALLYLTYTERVKFGDSNCGFGLKSSLYFSTHYFFILANLVTCQFCYRLLSVDRIYDGRYFLV